MSYDKKYAARWRAKQYAAGRHFVRGRVVHTPRRQRAPGDEPEHGTSARYNWSYGRCRCAECRHANTVYQRLKRARNKADREDQMVRDDSKWKRIALLFEDEINDELQIVVSVNESLVDGHRLIDVRQFWRHNTSEDWMASRKGISMPLHEWEVIVAIIQTWLDDNT